MLENAGNKGRHGYAVWLGGKGYGHRRNWCGPIYSAMIIWSAGHRLGILWMDSLGATLRVRRCVDWVLQYSRKDTG